MDVGRYITSPCILASLFALMVAGGCHRDVPAQPEVPSGYEATLDWGVRHAANALVDGGAVGQGPLLDPWTLQVVPSGPLTLDSVLYVAERRAWRILRFEVASLEPLSLHSPRVMVSAESWRSEGALIDVSVEVGRPDGFFGAFMAVSLDEEVVFTGPRGDLWVSAPAWDAAIRLGGGESAFQADDGVAVGEANLKGVLGLTIDEGGQGRPEAVVLTTDRAVFSFEVEGLLDPTVPLRRVAGSGALGQSPTPAAALSAPLDLRTAGPVAVDEDGNLFILEVDAGRLLMVPDYHGSEPTLLRVAGVGRLETGALDLAPENLRWDATGSRHLRISSEGEQRHLDFTFFGGSPFRVTLSPDGDQPLGFEVTSAANIVLAALPGTEGGACPAGDLVLTGDNLVGSIVSYVISDAADPVPTHVYGPRRDDFRNERGFVEIDASFLPAVQRPGAVVRTRINAIEHLVFADLATSYVSRELPTGQLDTFIVRRGGTDYSVFRNLASLGGSEERDPRLALVSTAQTILYDVAAGTSNRIMRQDVGQPSLSGAALGAFKPRQAPTLVGTVGQQFLVMDWDQGVVLSVDSLGPITAGSKVSFYAGQPTGYGFPIERQVGASVLDLSKASAVSLGAQGFMTVILSGTARGDVVLAIRSRDVGTVEVLGRVFDKPSSSFVVAGGGARQPEEGGGALEAGFTGLVSAELLADGAMWMTRTLEGRTGLVKVDAGGGLGLTVDPRGAEALGADEQGPVPLAQLVTQGEAGIDAPPCMPEGSALLLAGDGVWWLNTSEDVVEGPAGTLGPEEGVKIREEPALEAFCREGELALLEDQGGQVLLVEAGRRLALSGGPFSSMKVSDGGQVVAVGATAGGPALLTAAAEALAEAESPPFEVVSGAVPSLLEGRKVFTGGLSDELTVYAGGPDGLLWGAAAGSLFRFVPTSGELSQNSRIEVLWTGEPLGEIATAIAFEEGERPRALVASRGRLYRFTLDLSREAVNGEVQRGTFELLAGGGDRFPGFGAPARQARMPMIEGIVVDSGRVWLRWGGFVGYIDPAGLLVGIAGGGSLGPGEADAPWKLSLDPSVGAHPAIAIAPDGAVVTPSPMHGVYLHFYAADQ